MNERYKGHLDHTWEIFEKDADKKWKWRKRAPNRRPVKTSKSFDYKSDCIADAKLHGMTNIPI